MATKPKLSDFQFVNHQFSAGDRILVKTSVPLDSNQRRKIERAIRKSVGEHVRILIVDVRLVRILCQNGFETRSLTYLDEDETNQPRVGQFTLECSVVDFKEGDSLLVFIPNSKYTNKQVEVLRDNLREWAGSDVEIRIEGVRLDIRFQ